MTKTTYARTLSVQGSISRVLASPLLRNRIALEKEDESGIGTVDDDAAAAAAAKAAKDKAEAEAAEKAAREKDDESGKDKLSDAEAKLLKELMAAKNDNKGLKGKAAEADALKKELEDLGGLDELKALVAARKDQEKIALEKKGEFEALKKMIVEENQKKVADAESKAKDVGDQLTAAQRTIDDLTIGAAFAASPVITDLVLTPAKTRQLYGDHFEREDGVIVAYNKAKGETGRVKIVDGSGEPVSFDEALKKLIDQDPDRDKLLKSKVKAGAGSSTTDEKTSEKPAELTGAARIAAALAKRQKA